MTHDATTNGESEGHFRALVEAAPVAIFTLAVEDGSMTSFNPAFECLTGWPEDSWIGRPMTALVHRGDLPSFISCLHQVTLGTTPSPFELRIRNSAGAHLRAELTMTPQIEDGRVSRVLGFARDVSERHTVVRDLRAAKEAAEAASHAKSEFLANMSHEIRTPLNAIIGMTSLLLDMTLEGQAKAFARTIRTSSQTLLGLINGILDFSKIESGKLDLENQPFRLRDAVTSSLDLVRASAREKGLELTMSFAPNCPEALYGDVTRVRQVLANLLSNAVKFTDEGSIDVRVEARLAAAEEYEVGFAVRDTGTGISAQEQERIFDAFSQADASTSRRFGGTGLGLSISKRLTELMGGTLEVESTPGEGSTFRFTIRAHAARRAVPSTEPAQVDAELARKYPMRILVAEDHPINQVVAQLLLERLGYQPDLVGDGQEALDALERQSYDLVFMDVHMPVVDGLEATRRIRQRYANNGGPQIVAMTASAMKGDRELCLEAGMNDFVAKPIFIEELQETLTVCARRMLSGYTETAGDGFEGRQPIPDAGDLAQLEPIDPSALERLEKLDAKQVGGFVDQFLDTARQEIERIRTACEAGDADELTEAAHALKGSSGIFGAVRLQKICLDMELLGRQGATAKAEGMIGTLEEEMEEVRGVLGSRITGPAQRPASR